MIPRVLRQELKSFFKLQEEISTKLNFGLSQMVRIKLLLLLLFLGFRGRKKTEYIELFLLRLVGHWYKIYLQKLWLNHVFSLSNKVPILRLHDVEHMPKNLRNR